MRSAKRLLSLDPSTEEVPSLASVCAPPAPIKRRALQRLDELCTVYDILPQTEAPHPCPPLSYERPAVDRPTMGACLFCPASVERDPVSAARHILFACRAPSEEAKAAARTVLGALPEDPRTGLDD